MNHRRVRNQGVLLLTILIIVLGIPTYSGTNFSQARSEKTRRPFRMLVLGDSVVWGQGLDDEHKFSYQIGEWICAQRTGGTCQNKDDVQIHVEAHSGAVIAQPTKDDQRKEEARFTRIDSPIRYPGEVNHKYPTVWGQVDLARRYYAESSIPLEEVDLILVNGGINDMSATKILQPFFGGSVTGFARKYCEAEMKLLLEKVARTFPSARIVVPGYFPLVSISTPDNILSETLGYLFLGKKVKTNDKGAIEEASTKPPVEVAAAPKLSSWLKNLAKRSQQWTEASNNSFEAAVKSFNSGRPGLPLAGKKVPSPPPTASMRALFVVIPFRNENAYAAKDAFLWKLIPTPTGLEIECARKDSLKKLIASDELQTKRPCMCDQAGKGDDIICLWAGAFHPNVQGADLYFRSITKELERILPYTGWAAK